MPTTTPDALWRSPYAKPGIVANARWSAGTCTICRNPIIKGESIRRRVTDWVHEFCPSHQSYDR